MRVIHRALACVAATMLNNPSLKQYPRQQPAPLLPASDEPDLLTWLENSGRLIARDNVAEPEFPSAEEEEISALMGGEDSSYDDDYEDDSYDED